MYEINTRDYQTLLMDINQSKETALLLLFYISVTQWIFNNAHNSYHKMSETASRL